MNFKRSVCLASALAVAAGTAGPLPARAQSAAQIASVEAALNFIQRLSMTYLVLVARAAVDFTYESLTVDRSGSETVINGLVIRPDLEWDIDGACIITVERVAATGSTSLEVLESLVEISGATVPTACLDPGIGSMLASFGYETLSIDRAAMTLGYDVASSGAELLVSADLDEAAEVTVEAVFDYAYITGLLEDDEPKPVAKLRSAEVVIENDGVWERVSPMLEAQFGDLNQLPMMVGPMLGQVLAEPGQPMGAAEQAFVEDLSAELGRFVQNGDRLVLTMAPEGGVWLDEGTFLTPQTTIAALQPEVSGRPLAIETMLSPDTLSAAMSGGQGLDEAAKLRAGEAMITGIGAPRSLSDGLDLLAPLAADWNGEAARLSAMALRDSGQATKAYDMALKAMAGGASGAIGLADGLEDQLSTSEVLSAQEAAMSDWPGAADFETARSEAGEAGNVAAMRRLAFDAASGRDMPRSYVEAYVLASLAAAAGDTGAAALRDRIDGAFVDLAGEPDDAWLMARDTAASRALEAWTGGIAANVSARYQSAN